MRLVAAFLLVGCYQPVSLTESVVDANEIGMAGDGGAIAPVGWWKFNDVSQAMDSSGNGNDVSLDMVDWEIDSHDGTKSLLFDTPGALAHVGDNAPLADMPAFTIAFWLAPNSFPSATAPLVAKQGSGGGWGVYLTHTGTVQFVHTFSGGELDLTSQVAVNPSEWHHVAVTWSGGPTPTDATIYQDGLARTVTVSSTGSGTAGSDHGARLDLGNDDTLGKFYEGGLDDVQIFNRVLSAGEIAAIVQTSS